MPESSTMRRSSIRHGTAQDISIGSAITRPSGTLPGWISSIDTQDPHLRVSLGKWTGCGTPGLLQPTFRTLPTSKEFADDGKDSHLISLSLAIIVPTPSSSEARQNNNMA